MEASNLLVQEIWDEILDYLYNLRKDLWSSALACRAFTVRAQMHLFCSIQLDDSRLKTSQLAEILSSSPHLVAYIRNLYIHRCDARTLTPIARIAWSHLSAISLQHVGGKRPCVELLSPLVSLPTLRKVHIRGAWNTYSLHAVLANCNPSVTGLAFLGCFIKPAHATPEDNAALRLRSSPPRITDLEIIFSMDIPDWLVDAACPLDLSRLLHVKHEFSTARGLPTLLHAVGCTIESLRIEAGDLKQLDLGHFPALSHVTVTGNGDDLRGAIQRCCEINVHTICLRFTAMISQIELGTIQSIIFSAAPPALRRIEVEISTTENHHAQFMALIEGGMPQLAKRGMLAITFR